MINVKEDHMEMDSQESLDDLNIEYEKPKRRANSLVMRLPYLYENSHKNQMIREQKALREEELI